MTIGASSCMGAEDEAIRRSCWEHRRRLKRQEQEIVAYWEIMGVGVMTAMINRHVIRRRPPVKPSSFTEQQMFTNPTATAYPFAKRFIISSTTALLMIPNASSPTCPSCKYLTTPSRHLISSRRSTNATSYVSSRASVLASTAA